MKKSLLVLVLAVLVAGCVGSQRINVDPNRGLTIISFNANPSSVNAGESVLFDIEIENIGGTTASNAQIDLFGVENQWRDSFGNPIDSTLTKELRTLKPPEPTRGVPGQRRLEQYTLITPPVPQGVSPTFTIEARVTYDYNTSGFIDIPAVSEDEWRRKQILKETISPPTVVNSAGPIKMSMETRFSPIRIDTTSDEDTEIWPLKIILQNVGDGFPITPEDSETIRGAGGRITGTIQILGPGAEFSECLGETSGTLIDLDSTEVILKLRQDGSVPIACTISIDKGAWGDRPEDSVKLIFELFYRYYVSSAASIQVTGR